MADQNLNIKINTSADNKGIDITKKELTGIKDVISKLVSDIPLIGSLFSSLGAGLGVIGAVVAGFGALAAGVKKAVQEYAAAQEKITRLDAALAQQGNLTKEYRIELQSLASQMQKTTGIADDEWYGVFEKLTKLGGAGPENIKATTDAVKNLSAALDVDLNTSATLIAKAMQGNYAMFTRYGIVVEKTGSQTEKLEKLFAQLAQRGGGILEARATTLSGQMKQLSNNWSDFLEAFGRTEAKVGLAQRGIESLSYALEWWAEVLGGSIDQVGELENKHKILTDSAEQTGEAVKSLTDNFDRQRISSEKLSSQLDRQKQSMKELQRQQDEMDDVTMALELEKVETKASQKTRQIKESNTLTDEQKKAQIEVVESDKLKATSSIRRQYEIKKFEREQDFARKETEENTKQLKDLDTRSEQRPKLIQEQEEKLQQAGQYDEQEALLIDRLKVLEKGLKLNHGLINQMPPAMKKRYFEKQAEGREEKSDLELELEGLQSERQKKGIGATATEAQKLEALKAKTEQERKADEELYQKLLDENAKLKSQLEHRQKIQAVKNEVSGLSDTRQINQSQDKTVEQARVAVSAQAKTIRMADGKETADEVSSSFTQAFAQLAPGLGQDLAHALYPLLQDMMNETRKELQSQIKNQRSSMP